MCVRVCAHDYVHEGLKYDVRRTEARTQTLLGSVLWRVTSDPTGASGRVGGFPHREGGGHPVQTHAQRQLRESHGRGRQRRLGWKPQTVAQDAGETSQLPQSHAAITHRDDHAQVREAHTHTHTAISYFTFIIFLIVMKFCLVKLSEL